MTPVDLDRIESELQIKLPIGYRRGVAPFPVPAEAGHSDGDLWDDADELIKLNRELRSRDPRWSSLFAIGSADGSSQHALDLADEAAPVWWVDHGDLAGKGSGPIAPSFDEWAEQYLRDLRADLEKDGIDSGSGPRLVREGNPIVRLFVYALIGLAAMCLIIWLTH